MIYLDNCSTTKLRKEVKDILIKSYEEDFSNPSSLHRLGMKQEDKINEARCKIAKSLGVTKNEIYFTSGGTESNNTAIRGTTENQPKKSHIITSKIEHPSVLRVMEKLEKDGYRISYLDVDSKGLLDLKQLKDSICRETILVSIMHVNNEIGSIQNIEKISKIIRSKNKDTIFHVDGVQAYGKIPFKLKELDVDLYSFSSHKIHGPKGIGGLYINNLTNIDPYILGGGQERGLRSGTENTQAILGFAKAVDLMMENQIKEYDYIYELKKYTIKELKETILDFRVNTGNDQETSPYILSISFKDVLGQVLLNYLQDDNIYISTSSACSSRGTDKSHVLKAIGLSDNYIEGTIRLCFSYDNTREEIDILVLKLKEYIKEIRKITR